MAAESSFFNRTTAFCFKWRCSTTNMHKSRSKLLSYSTICSSASMEDQDKLYKQLGLFSLKKKIEDAVLRAQISAATALELEEAMRIKQEIVMREFNLWDDPVKFNDILGRLADSAKVIDTLRDLKYKAEEARLISQLAEAEGINYRLFKQAYSASLDVNKFLDQYEMAKLLKGPYDKEGASVSIKSGSETINSKIWAEQLQGMYIKWAKKLGYEGRLVDKHLSMSSNADIHSTTIEFEFECAYGYLSGERGIHCVINSENGSAHYEVEFACVDVVPLFIGPEPDLQINDKDLIISSSLHEEQTVCIHHIPTGLSIQSSGERSRLANEIKALNRLKAKLLVIAEEQNFCDIRSINKERIVEIYEKETRRYISYPNKLVQDVKTGIQLPDLNSVLDGNIEPLLGAHIRNRHTG